MLEDNLTELAQKHPDIPDATVAAARLLLSSVVSNPPELARGYWPTICIVWARQGVAPLEVEVGDAQFEFYNGMDIRHFDHAGGTNLPTELVNLLREQL